MNDNNSIGFLGLLGLLFVALKLTGYISWSWWYVTLPFWGGFALGFALVFGIAVISLLFLVIVSLIEK
jgi:hypothetical protein